MKHVDLTQGYVAVVDDDVYTIVSQYKWRVSVQRRKRCRDQITAIANLPRTVVGKAGKTIYMHRVLMEHWYGDISGKIIDHINHNKLDNRKENLRFVTRQQNSANMQKKIAKASSKYKGVCYVGYKNKPWRMSIKINGKRTQLSFATEEEAALEYNKRALEAFGSYAKLNVID